MLINSLTLRRDGRIIPSMIHTSTGTPALTVLRGGLHDSPDDARDAQIRALLDDPAALARRRGALVLGEAKLVPVRAPLGYVARLLNCPAFLARRIADLAAGTAQRLI